MEYLTRRSFEEHVLRKAADPQFRDQLIDNPKAVLAAELGIPQLPDDLQIEVVEEDPNRVVLVLPPRLEEEQEKSVGPLLASGAFAAVVPSELELSTVGAECPNTTGVACFSNHPGCPDTSACWSE